MVTSIINEPRLRWLSLFFGFVVFCISLSWLLSEGTPTVISSGFHRAIVGPKVVGLDEHSSQQHFTDHEVCMQSWNRELF
jgi:hypothetical protein